ncbi:hypothetical protein CC1_21190 [Coprococcus catus GD/7]|uniref:Uncharacterized protein n=1 Tax=Coprococcus catus GD/7 TaxID=717962 RepID=D4J907_9FIRM|nr:hypothetical protein CC1_21190 [Coprococcus catus GD/7]
MKRKSRKKIRRSFLMDGGHKPLDSILDMRIKLITICESRMIVEADN